MNVRELRRRLDEVEDDNVEVRIATQPHWPFEHEVENVVLTDKTDGLVPAVGEDGSWFIINPDDDDAIEAGHGPHPTEEAANAVLSKMREEQVRILYLSEGEQVGYLPGEARRALSW